MGGKDIYSSSKAAAEIFISSYFRTFLNSKDNLTLAVGRAGNVIGGGDWARDRLVVDCMKAWQKKESVSIRNPLSTRPWQHVLEPLSGYLHLANLIYESREFNGEAFNFGPNQNDILNVESLIKKLSKSLNLRNLIKLLRAMIFLSLAFFSLILVRQKSY